MTAPTAQAIVVAGGYRVTGRQGFSTGCRHASWIAAHAQIIENGEVRLKDGKPEARYLLLPVAQAELNKLESALPPESTASRAML